MTQASTPLPDLSACASEPIHIPGAIQPHGGLLAVDLAGKVLQASANAAGLLQCPAGILAGQPLGTLLDTESVAELSGALALRRIHEGRVRTQAGGDLWATCHFVGDTAVVELEPIAEAVDFAGVLEEAMRTIATVEDFSGLVASCSTHVRRLSGFDRVLVYRFDEDGHGEVIAEDRHAELESYLGHHYPESDIPRQARALYLRNWIRCIPDARYVPVKLVPALRPDTGEPLDLSGAHLRSVSPVHLEYLANMGVRASMSVSLIVEGRLWGLISCGHRTPKAMPPALRRAGETIGRLLSARLAALQATDFHRREAAARPHLEVLCGALRSNPPGLLASLVSHPADLLELVGASGAAVLEDGAVTTVGAVPLELDVRAIAEHVRTRLQDGQFFTRELPREHAALEHLAAHASGVMAVALPDNRMLAWFRPEVPYTVPWGGDPHKSAGVEVDHGVPRLHPRRSFAVWKEEVRGKSLPWHAAERHLAAELRRQLVEVDLARQVESHKAAVRAREELVAVVSHDLRTPVSIVAMQATLMQRLLGADPAAGSKRLATSALVIGQAADRMTSMLRDLIDLTRIESGRFVISPSRQDAGELIEEACALMAHLPQARHLRLVAQRPQSSEVLADPERIFHVFANLIGNAVKFSPEGGTITVGAHPLGDVCQFYVRDTGRGIAPDQLEQIFGRYAQGRSTDPSSGLGLGLYICRGIVAAHGGRIWAESDPGAGSTFRFELPRAPAAGAAPGG